MRIFAMGMFSNPNAEELATIKSAEFAHFSIVGTWDYQREPCEDCDYYW